MQGAVESLPHISTTADPNENPQRIAAGAENLVAPTAAPTTDFPRDLHSPAVTLAVFPKQTDFADTLAATAMSGNEKRSLSLTDSERSEIGLAGFEPTTSYTPSRRASQTALQPVKDIGETNRVVCPLGACRWRAELSQ